MHIVIVDPSRVVRKSVSEMLRLGGHTVVDFEDSQAALNHVQADERVTCVLTSLELHPLDGLELCWSLRALADQRRPLSILVMSAGRERRQLGEVLDAGADDFMAKPPDRSELYARLRAAERVLGLQRALIRQADNDHLTQILNRGGFLRQAQAAVETASAEPLTVLQLDIDHFKRINDRHGHDAGDVVIRGVADVLRQTGALAGRLGGEEFALLMRGHGFGAAGIVAHRIRTRCAGLTLKAGESALRFTVSIGVAERAGRRDDIEALLKRADVALYAAKSGGRDRVVLADGAMMTECVS